MLPIPPETELTILTLLRESCMLQKEIARAVGVSEKTIKDVRQRGYARPWRPKANYREPVLIESLKRASVVEIRERPPPRLRINPESTGRPIRCEHCGGKLLVWPCPKCSIPDGHLVATALRNQGTEPDVVISLDLRPADLARLRKLRRKTDIGLDESTKSSPE